MNEHTENERKDDEMDEQITNKEEESPQKSESDNLETNQDSPSDEIGQVKDKYLRLVAEFDNFRKRTAREKMDLIKSANEDLLNSMLDVLDDMERAEEQMEKSSDVKALKDGVQLIFNKLRNTLKAKGLQPMESLHQEFNPELHDAITEIPAPPEQQGKVMDEIKKGYYLNDKIIRHAKVVVGK